MHVLSKSVLVMLISITMAGCATSPVMRDVIEPTADTKIVFGSAEVFVDNKRQEWGGKWDGWHYFHLLILPPDTNEAISYKLSKNGEFYWALPPNEYTLLGYIWHKGKQRLEGDIRTKFTVPDTEGDRYIGAIEFHGMENFLLPYFKDKYAQAKVSYDTKFPARKGTSVKQLLEMSEPVGKFIDIIPACHASLEIECTERFRGVTPNSPMVADRGFPAVQTLRPEFQWKGSARKDVSYDLILYEAAVYTMAGAAQNINTKGRMVIYAENLKEPTWRIENPLKPSTKYYWSVRVRDGDKVSTWSTQGYSFNWVLAWGSGFGQWFQFQTQ